MILTNPGQAAYEEYAVERLTVYLKEDICTQAPKELGEFLQRQCSTLVDTGRPQIGQVVSSSTHRQNLFFFSIYRTDFSGVPFAPDYQFETVGAFQNFITYRAEQL